MVSVRRRRPQAEVSGEIVEKGDIYFAYRPPIEEDSAEGLADVQRFYMVMRPEGQARLRMAVLGRKRLPEARDHERIWGFIEAVKSGPAVEDEFHGHHYTTKTRGERTLPPVRPAGEGVYALLKRDRSLHLTYELELPQRPGQVQEELNIERQAAYILSIKNPEAGSPPGAGLSERQEAHYPKPLEQEFRGRRFASEDRTFSTTKALSSSWSARAPIPSAPIPNAPMRSISRPNTRRPAMPTFSASSRRRHASIRSVR